MRGKKFMGIKEALYGLSRGFFNQNEFGLAEDQQIYLSPLPKTPNKYFTPPP